MPTRAQYFSFCCPISLKKFMKVLSKAVRCVFWSNEVLHLRISGRRKLVGFAQKCAACRSGVTRIQAEGEGNGHHRSPFESGQCPAAPEGPPLHICATAGMSRYQRVSCSTFP